MRLQPPKTEKEEFDEIEFRDYVWRHEVLGLRQYKTFKDFVDDIFSSRNQREKISVIPQLLTLWPREYQNEVEKILNEYGKCEKQPDN